MKQRFGYVSLTVLFLLTGCATTLKDYQGFIEKYPQYRYCALAVEPVANGMTDDAVRLGRVASHTHCDSREIPAQYDAISNCNKRTGKSCVLAYTYDRYDNSYKSNQSANERDNKNAIIESRMQECDAYGFKRGTPAMANCVMQIDLAHKQLQRQQQQAEAAYNQKVQQCRSMWGQGMGQPTMSGGFGESLGNANTAYQNCMAGVPTAPTQVICNRSPNPQVNYVYCTTR